MLSPGYRKSCQWQNTDLWFRHWLSLFAIRRWELVTVCQLTIHKVGTNNRAIKCRIYPTGNPEKIKYFDCPSVFILSLKKDTSSMSWQTSRYVIFMSKSLVFIKDKFGYHQPICRIFYFRYFQNIRGHIQTSNWDRVEFTKYGKWRPRLEHG